MDYQEKISLLEEGDFFNLLSRLNVQPRWVMSAGKRAIQIIGACHHGENHSALFDPDTMKVNCFSECGKGMLFHTFIKQALNLDSSYSAQEYILEWIEKENLDLSNRISRNLDFEYQERPYEVTDVRIVGGIPEHILIKIKQNIDYSDEALEKLLWHTQDGIDVDILRRYEIGYHTKNRTIILPHHNIYGEIVGFYERSFNRLRKEIAELYPHISRKELLQWPRAKYVPLLRDEEYREENKNSWSFPNSFNLYGLHFAQFEIARSGQAIIFEGAKSVMLAMQYGVRNCVATHTFGAHLNHISMLIKAGAKEIFLAFDKQYQKDDDKAWELYERKTQDLATRVGNKAIISRIRDNDNDPLLDFKDSPIDKGEEIFKRLLKHPERLSRYSPKRKLQDISFDKYSIKIAQNDNFNEVCRNAQGIDKKYSAQAGYNKIEKKVSPFG